MTVKNAVSASWNLLQSFDGLKYSNYPAGNKPSGYVSAPTLIDTDITSGSLTGGEGNSGAYLSLFGYSFGRQPDLGTSAGARVYMRDPLGDNAWHEVANYRALIKSKVYTALQVVQIICQVGTLGGSQVAGRALDIKITVNGVDTNVLTGQFTIQPGRFWFADNVNGSDATGKPDDITKPFRYAQFAVGGANSYTGIWASTTAQGDTGLRAGDTIVLRANAGHPWTDNTGFDGRFVRFRSHTGTAPTGAVGHGYIHFTRYPGPILGHAPEAVVYADPPGGGGCLQGVNTAYQGIYGMYWSVSGWKMTCDDASRGDAGMINFQTSSDYARVYDCEAGPWHSTLVTPDNAKAGGIAGNGIGCKMLFNYVHDIYCDANNPNTSANENHGIYLDGSQFCAKNCVIAYNWIKNCVGGSGYQSYNADAPDTQSGHKIYNNVIDTTRKYGINFADATQSSDCWNNVVLNTLSTGIRTSTQVTNARFNISHNLVWNCNTSGLGPAQGAINNDATLGSGTIVNVDHNVIVLAANRSAASPSRTSNEFYTANGADGGFYHFHQNLYYDPDSLVPALSGDANAITGDPLWTDPSNGNFTVRVGSPTLNACTLAEVIAIPTDLYGIVRPVTGTGSPGSTKNDIGPFQGVGQ